MGDYDPIADGEARRAWADAKRQNPGLKIADKHAVKNYAQTGPDMDAQPGRGSGCLMALNSPLGWIAIGAGIALLVLLFGG